MIEVQQLVYEYPGKRALEGVTFHIPEGEVTALVGPNGAGKSTLLRCIAGLDEPFSGQVLVDGVDVTEAPRTVHRMLGYLSDFFGVYNELTVHQCLELAARMHQLEPPLIAGRIDWVVALLGLEPYLATHAGSLSRGWRQRLGMAQAMIHRPRLLLLDEPASGLDPEARVAISALFRQLHAEGMTLVVSSHILMELEDYCTSMLVLREGRVVDHRAYRADAGTQVLEIRFSGDPALVESVVKPWPGVSKMEQDGQKICAHFDGDEKAQQALLKALITRGVMVTGFSLQPLKLQDVYLEHAEQRHAH